MSSNFIIINIIVTAAVTNIVVMAGPRHLVVPGRLIIRYQNSFGLGQGWPTFLERVTKLRIIFEETLSYVSDYSCDVLVSLIVLSPGKLPGWSAP